MSTAPGGTAPAAASQAAAAVAAVESGYDEEESPENLVAKFQTLAAEGDLLAKRRSYAEAIVTFTRALEIRPSDRHCLVARAQCLIRVGQADGALRDAEAALKEQPDYFKAVLSKAEALYAKGDFELALMHFHRGNRLRPELDDFRVGIQKAREAIENSIGHHKEFKITAPSVPVMLTAPLSSGVGTISNASPSGGAGSDSATAAATAATGPMLTPTMEAKLLGELYEDKIYLQSLLRDRDLVEHPDKEVIALVERGLGYLDTRVDFWRQQNPLYARRKVRRIKSRGRADASGDNAKIAAQ